MLSRDNRLRFLTFLCLAAIIAVAMLDPIAQDIHYHQFKDQRTIFSIPHFWNVVSNLPFLFVGLYGLYSLFYSGQMKIIEELKSAYVVLFLGVALVALGSGYYHLAPTNMTLVWDRLPMTFAFMALVAIVIGEFISVSAGKRLLWPLVIVGIFSVFYWYKTEMNGAGDLRLYVLVQFITVLLIPLVLILFKPVYDMVRGYWYLTVAYILAKIFEYFDAIFLEVLCFISGHSLKHIAAATGVFMVVKMYNQRSE